MSLINGLPENKMTFKQEAKLSKTEPGRQQLVMCNLREAFFYAKKVSYGRVADDETLSLCYTALRNAARNYCPRKNHQFSGSRFFGYTKPYIRGEIFRFWKRAEVVKNGKCQALPDGLNLQEQDTPSPEEQDTPQPVIIANPAVHLIDPREEIFDRMDRTDRWQAIAPLVMSALSDDEKMVIDLYYRGEFNFEQIGKLMEISRSAIQSKHSRAIKKIREALLKAGKLETVKV